MMKCAECDAIFDELVEIHKPGGCYEADYGVYSDFDSHTYYSAVNYMGCPHCGASEDDCYELEECERCGVFADDVDHGLCDCCYDELHG